MPAASGNFTEVRFIDHTTITITGTSEKPETVDHVDIIVGKVLLAADDDNPGGPLVDEAKRLAVTIPGSEFDGSLWTGAVKCEPGTHKRGDLVVVCGAHKRTGADDVGYDDLWANCCKIVGASDPPPKPFDA